MKNAAAGNTERDAQRTLENERDAGGQPRLAWWNSGRGWWDIAMRVKREITTDNVSTIAAGLA